VELDWPEIETPLRLRIGRQIETVRKRANDPAYEDRIRMLRAEIDRLCELWKQYVKELDEADRDEAMAVGGREVTMDPLAMTPGAMEAEYRRMGVEP